MHQEDFSNASRWTDLGILNQSQIDTLLSQGQPVYNSNLSSAFAAEIDGKFAVLQPVEMEPVKLIYRNLGNLLFAQRATIVGWIVDHQEDAEAVARYQVQLDAVDDLLEQYGLISEIPGPNNQPVKISKQDLDLLFVEVPNIVSSPGSIFIEATRPLFVPEPTFAAAFQGLVTSGRLEARAGTAINLLNESPFTMIVNGALVEDNLRVTTDENGKYLALKPGNVYINKSPLTNVDVGTAKVINIIQDAAGPYNQFDLANLPIQPADIDQDLYINGDVINKDGNVLIRNVEGSIFVNGEIRAEQVDIFAAKDFNLNTDAWLHTNRDPRQYFNYDTFRATLYDLAEIERAIDFWFNLPPEASRIIKPDTNFSDGTTTLQQSIDTDESRILAGGVITITAKFLNVNGLIQSGAENIEFGVSSNFVPPTYSGNFVAENGVDLLPGISFGTSGVPINGHWDANRKVFVLDDISPEGGKITIAGKLLSTGNGRLKVANGYPSINIDNDSPYVVEIGEIDTTVFREGIITIIDSGLLTKAEYKYVPNTNQIQQTRFTGVLVPPGPNGEISHIEYTPLPSTNHALNESLQYSLPTGLQYIWTEGQRKTVITRTEYIRDNSWYVDWFPYIDFDEIEKIEFPAEELDDLTVESETVFLTGTNGVDARNRSRRNTRLCGWIGILNRLQTLRRPANRNEAEYLLGSQSSAVRES